MTDALQSGLRAKGFQVVTPPANNSAIVTFAYANAAQLAPRLAPAKIEITLRADHARISPSGLQRHGRHQQIPGSDRNPP